MALVTLCPDCGTTYRVRAEQLQAHGGKVSCGQCQSIFNGFSTLITVDESEITHPIQSANQSSADSNDNNELTSSFSSDWGEESTEDTEDTEGTEGTEDTEGTESTEDVDDLYNPFDQELTPKSSRTWALASLFMVILLLAQVTHIFRLELTEIAPGTRPYLEKYCAILSCTLPYPQHIDLLSIETSDLQVNSKNESEVLTLTATIRNYAAYPLALPQLKFSLTDIHNQLLASRMLTVQDYLQEDADSVVLIQPNDEINIKAHFDGNNLNSTGYRLLLMY